MGGDLAYGNCCVLAAKRAAAAIVLDTRAVGVDAASALRRRRARTGQAAVGIGDKPIGAADVARDRRTNELAAADAARGDEWAAAVVPRRTRDFAACTRRRIARRDRVRRAIAALRPLGDAVRGDATLRRRTLTATRAIAAVVVTRQRVGLERTGTTGREHRDEEDKPHCRFVSAEPVPSITLRYRVVSSQFFEGTPTGSDPPIRVLLRWAPTFSRRPTGLWKIA